MTTPAIIRTAELKRMAKVAREEGVDCWIERDGYRFGVSPRRDEREKEIDRNDEITL